MKNKQKSNRPKERKTRPKQATSSCRTTGRSVTELCLADAMLSLAYEANQVTNYIKQSKRLDNHHKISKNKLTKKDEFTNAAKHMLWAIGGNLSDPKCGETTSDTKRQDRLNRDMKSSISNYNFLLNCTNSIHEACDITLKNETYNHDDHSENMTLCNKFKKEFISVSKECVSNKDQSNVTLQCECWHKAAKDVAIIKKLKCELCEFMSKSVGGLKAHIRLKHTSKTRDWIHCKYCNYNSKLESDLEKHTKEFKFTLSTRNYNRHL